MGLITIINSFLRKLILYVAGSSFIGGFALPLVLAILRSDDIDWTKKIWCTTCGGGVIVSFPAQKTRATTNLSPSEVPFIISPPESLGIPSFLKYSDDWIGTHLNLVNLVDSIQLSQWPMGRWPDPILRRPALPIDEKWYGSLTLQLAASLLQQTAKREGAVGLAAQQCGVDARMVFVEGRGVLVNPHIVSRSPETEMRVWQEQCLVLPPTFVATVLRDAWVDVEYHTIKGNLRKMRLYGELSRCVQHEMDHDRGILVLDHIDLEEMESNKMREIESNGHDSRMLLAYSRQIDPSFT